MQFFKWKSFQLGAVQFFCCGSRKIEEREMGCVPSSSPTRKNIPLELFRKSIYI